MRRFFYAVFILAFVENAQGNDQELFEAIQTRQIIIKIMEEDPSVVKKMTKRDPAKLSAYKNNIKQSNALLKQSMRKYWKHHQAPLYKTQAEINQMRAMEKSKKKKSRKSYVIMSLDFFSEKHKTREESEVETNAKYTGDATYLFLRFWEGDEIVYTSLPHVIPTQVDLVYGVRYLSNQVAGMQFGKDITALCEENGPQVRGKTLLVTAFQVAELKEKDLLKIYPYPYKIVEQSEIDQAILSSNQKYAVIVETDQSDTMVMKTIILTGTGQFAGYVTSILRKPFTKKEFKQLVKYTQ